MHARIRPVRKTRTILLSPLFVLPCLSENFQSTGTSSLHPAEHHRPDRISTGTSKFPSALYRIHRHSRWCRSALTSAGRQKPPAEDNLAANREQTVHSMEFLDTSKHGPTSYHILDSKKHDFQSLNRQWYMVGQRTEFATWYENACNEQHENRGLIKLESKVPMTGDQGTLHHLEYEWSLTPALGLTPHTK